MSAREAARLLGVKPATLYAYVSRGLLESVPAERRPRAALPARRPRAAARRGAARRRLRGAPLGRAGARLRHHRDDPGGARATAAARRSPSRAADTPFEAVAELLWTRRRCRRGGRSGRTARGSSPPSAPSCPRAPRRRRCTRCVVAALAPLDAGRFDLRSEAVLERARRLIRTLAASLVFLRPERSAPASAARRRWPREASRRARRSPSASRRAGAPLAAIDRVLVLLADHELNVSTFAARVAASAHADPYAAVLAGLAAFSGPRHGAASDRVEALARRGRGARRRRARGPRARAPRRADPGLRPSRSTRTATRAPRCSSRRRAPSNRALADRRRRVRADRGDARRRPAGAERRHGRRRAARRPRPPARRRLGPLRRRTLRRLDRAHPRAVRDAASSSAPRPRVALPPRRLAPFAPGYAPRAWSASSTSTSS